MTSQLFQDLLVPGIPLAEKVVRTLAVYVFLLVGLRLAGKRELGQLNPFDLVVLLLLSNTVQNAIIGNDNSLVGGVVGATTLLMANWIVVRFLFSHPRVSRWLEGDPDLLIEHGKVHEERLRRELITQDELEAAARRQGFGGLDAVETCRLEVGGVLTFIERAPTADERRHRELVEQLTEIGTTQGALLQRMSALESRA
ncbi:MAG: DUF421 domain-containing protein [Gemmatimonadaceae bacterium]|nr:DUF421 domain-containing protein [Gemmatimonadaceae bacterium]